MVPTNDNYVLLNYYQMFVLAQIIDEQIFKPLPSATLLKNIYDYLKNIIRLINTLNIPIL
jgi:hypothetical protein